MLSSTRPRERSHSAHGVGSLVSPLDLATNNPFAHPATTPTQAATFAPFGTTAAATKTSNFGPLPFNPFSGQSAPPPTTTSRPSGRLHAPLSPSLQQSSQADFTPRALLALVGLLLLVCGMWQLGGPSRLRSLSASISAPPLISSSSTNTGPSIEAASHSTTWSPPQPAFAAISAPASATRSTLSSRSRSEHPSEPRVLLRILSSGASHAELERLLASLQAATYEATDEVDVEILIDLPRALADSSLPLPALEDDEQAPLSPAQEQLARLHDPVYQAAKTEYELVLLHARNFRWTRGSVLVRVVDGAAPQLGGLFNQVASFAPSTAALLAGHEEFALILRDANVVARDYFQAIKQLLRAHFTQMDAAGVTATTTVPSSPTNPDLMGIVLEPAESLLASPGGEGGPWSARSPESVFFASSGGLEEPALVLVQSCSTFSAGGGLLVRAKHFAQFRLWLVARGLMRRDPLGAPVSQDYGAPTAMLYDRTQGVQANHAACVRGLASNVWPQRIAGDSAEQAVAHLARIEQPWLILGLLQRFAHERGLLMVQPVWRPLGTKPAPVLITSSAFKLPPVADHATAASTDAARPPLPPLKRELLESKRFDGLALSTSSLPQVAFDFAGRPISRAQVSRLDAAPTPADCVSPSNAPGPPTFEPSDQQLAELALAQRASLAASKSAVVSSTGEVSPSLVDLKALSPAELLRVALRTASEHRSDLTARPGAAGTEARVLQQRELHENLTSIELKRWEEYEADFQFKLQRIVADAAATNAALAEHEELRKAHEAHLAHIREELDAKKLVDQLKKQLGTIQRQEREEAEDRAIEVYKLKKARLKEAEKAKKAKKEATKEEDEPETDDESGDGEASEDEDDKASKEKEKAKAKAKQKSKKQAGDDEEKKGKKKEADQKESTKDKDDKKKDSKAKPKKDSAKSKEKEDKKKKKKQDEQEAADEEEAVVDTNEEEKKKEKRKKKSQKNDPVKEDSKKEKENKKKGDDGKAAKKDQKARDKKDAAKEEKDSKSNKQEGKKKGSAKDKSKEKEKGKKEKEKDQSEKASKPAKPPQHAGDELSEAEVAAALANHVAREKAAKDAERAEARRREQDKMAEVRDVLKQGAASPDTPSSAASSDALEISSDEEFERLIEKRKQDKKKKKPGPLNLGG